MRILTTSLHSHVVSLALSEHPTLRAGCMAPRACLALTCGVPPRIHLFHRKPGSSQQVLLPLPHGMVPRHVLSLACRSHCTSLMFGANVRHATPLLLLLLLPFALCLSFVGSFAWLRTTVASAQIAAASIRNTVCIGAKPSRAGASACCLLHTSMAVVYAAATTICACCYYGVFCCHCTPSHATRLRA